MRLNESSLPSFQHGEEVVKREPSLLIGDVMSRGHSSQICLDRVVHYGDALSISELQ